MQVESVQRVPSAPPPRRGRPAKPDADRLSEILNFRVTQAEADSVYRLAIRHGKPLNHVLRVMLQRFIARDSVSK